MATSNGGGVHLGVSSEEAVAAGAGGGEAPLSHRTLLVPSRLDNDDITINLDDIFHPTAGEDDVQIVIELFKDERAPVSFWIRLIQEAWRLKKFTLALDVIEQGLETLDTKGRCSLLCLKANYFIGLARKAPKLILTQPRGGSTLTHSTDPNHPESKIQDPNAPPNTKEVLWQAAEVCIGRAEGLHVQDNKSIKDVKAILMLARGRIDEASRFFESILATEPTHLYALMGRARISFAKKSFRSALKTYQQVLSLAPNFQPDPRIGIGLCCWLLGDRKKAKAAWNRSLAVHPESSSTSATLLLGLAHLNTSKDPTLPGGEEARTKEYSKGIELIQIAFKKDNTSAAALGPLANYFLLSNRPGNGTIKLAERMIQFADARILVSEGYLHLARFLHSTGEKGPALTAYQSSSETFPDQLLALLAEAQFLIESNSWPAAVNLYENILRRHPRCIEALCALASIHTVLTFSDPSIIDSAIERKKAKEVFEQILRIFASGKEAGMNEIGGGGGHGGGGVVVNKYIAKSERIRDLAKDEEMFVEIGKIWEDELSAVASSSSSSNPSSNTSTSGSNSTGGDKSLKAFVEAQRILSVREEEEVQRRRGESGEEERPQSTTSLLATRLANNIGVLHYFKQDYLAAQENLEAALVKIGERIASNASGGKIDEFDDAALSICTFNRGIILEALGDDESAIKECYNPLLTQHPEFIEAKARLTLIALKSTKGGGGHSSTIRQKAFETANQYLKEMLTTTSSNLEVRALQSDYLYQAGLFKNLKEFARQTLTIDQNDAYALTTRGIVAFHEARENRDLSKEGGKLRQQLYLRSAQYFERALQQHKHCAIAAQGLGIAIAENVLGTGIVESNHQMGFAVGGGKSGGELMNSAQVALNRNTRDALTIFNKVKESLNDASVYVNIGHCHFHREEFERAVESYETASKRYHQDSDVIILQYLARAWYHKGVKDQSFNDIHIALEKANLALSFQPKDLSIKYNIALMQQKAVQILFDLPPQRRDLGQLELALKDGLESQRLFTELQTIDPNELVPYAKDMPRQRFNYGKSLLARSVHVQEAQELYERTEQAAVDRARQAREEERKRREQIELERLALVQEQAARLAEQRKRMQEEAAQWTLSANFADSEEDHSDGEKKERKKREKKVGGVGAGTGAGKKRSKKDKREEGSAEETAESSSDGEVDKPKKKKAKSKSKKDRRRSETPEDGMDLDEDGEEAVNGGNRRKRISRATKNIKSTEFIESSDED